MNYIRHEFMCHPRKAQVSEILPSTLLGVTLNQRQLQQPFSQQIERTLRQQLFEGSAIAWEKELLPSRGLIF